MSASEELQTDLKDWYRLDLSAEQVQSLCDRHPEFAQQLQRFGGSDTVIREEAANLLAVELTGQDWPIYADAGDSRQFFSAFYLAAQKAGIKVLRKQN